MSALQYLKSLLARFPTLYLPRIISRLVVSLGGMRNTLCEIGINFIIVRTNRQVGITCKHGFDDCLEGHVESLVAETS